MDVVAWLRGLGLERYAPAFSDNDVDSEVLPELTSDDLISCSSESPGIAIATTRARCPPHA